MEIRDLRPEEVSQLEQVLKASGVYNPPFDTPDALARKLAHDSRSIVVAEDKGRLVGQAFYIFDPWNSFVYRLGVVPECRGQGVAQLLMEEVERRLLEKGMSRPTLFVGEGNTEAVEFYRHRGWEVVGSAVVMEKSLGQ